MKSEPIRFAVVLGAGVALVIAAACSSSSSNSAEPACTPGEQKACSCGSGVTGFQVCRKEGSGYDTCSCGSGGTGGSGGGAGAGGSAGSTSYCAGLASVPAFCADFDEEPLIPFSSIVKSGGNASVDGSAAKSGLQSFLATTDATASPPVWAYGRKIFTSPNATRLTLETDLRIEVQTDDNALGLLRIVRESDYGSTVRIVYTQTQAFLEEELEAPDGGTSYVSHALNQLILPNVWSHVKIDVDATVPQATVTVDSQQVLSTPLDSSWTQGATNAIWIEAGILYASSAGWQVRHDNVVATLH